MGLWVALGASAAGAQEGEAPTDPYVLDAGQENGPSGDGNEVLDSSITRPNVAADTADTAGAADSAAVSEVKASTIPLTGTEVTTLAVIGGSLVLAGATVVATSRRRAGTES